MIYSHQTKKRFFDNGLNVDEIITVNYKEIDNMNETLNSRCSLEINCRTTGKLSVLGELL